MSLPAMLMLLDVRLPNFSISGQVTSRCSSRSISVAAFQGFNMEGLVFSANNYFLSELENWQKIKLVLLMWCGRAGKLIEAEEAVLIISQDTCLPSK